MAKDDLDLLIPFVVSSQVARRTGICHQAWSDGALALGLDSAYQAGAPSDFHSLICIFENIFKGFLKILN